jgi:hypothetical protein
LPRGEKRVKAGACTEIEDDLARFKTGNRLRIAATEA